MILRDLNKLHHGDFAVNFWVQFALPLLHSWIYIESRNAYTCIHVIAADSALDISNKNDTMLSIEAHG